MSGRKKSLMKSVTWRVTASLITMSIVWIISGRWVVAGEVTVVEIFVKMAAYYFHERVWEHIPARAALEDAP